MTPTIFAVAAGAACPVGDINGDCTVDFRDVWELGEQWLDGPAGAADLTGEGGVDMADLSMLAKDWGKTKWPIIINEIHSDPDVETELVEFVELYNAGPVDADLSGWSFRDGLAYTFPPETILRSGEYLVVTEDAYAAWSPVTLMQKYGTNAAKVYGPFTGNLRNFGEKIELCDAGGNEIDQVDYQLGFPWPTVGDPVPSNQPGKGHSMQLIDPELDNDLGGSWRSAYPTPGARNSSVFAANTPPHIRQVEHLPKSPVGDEPVTITAKITDPDGIKSVALRYQAVAPGRYIRLHDAQYSTSWTTVSMNDDGLGADRWADDDIFTVQLPASVQRHRRMIRYRIVAEDTVGNALTVPYPDDPQPNFAYFVYDGVPAWRGALEPGSSNPTRSAVKTFSAEVMRSLPVYHLMATETDVINCQYNSNYENVRFRGTLVYDGVVYDHIEFKIRGEWSTYQSGKNKWKFFFTRGHDFQVRDDYGKKYDPPWRVMNLSGCATPWMPAHRGMAGVDEALASALYSKASVPSSKTHWLQFRIIDDSVEADPSSQYEGDLWGLYLAIEYPDGRFLDEHGLPDGNTYKMEGGGDKKHQGATQPANTSDLNSFRSGYNQTNSNTWWKNNLNLKHYYGFRAINRAINNSDLREGWNCYYYHNSETDLWSVIPWDLDMLYMPVYHWSGVLNIQNCLNHPEFEIGYKNYGRELQDLLVSSDQISQLVDELASIVNPPGQPLTMVDVDEYMWNYHPRTRSGHRGKFYRNPITHNDFDGQSILKVTVSSDHEGEMQWIKDFIQPPPGGGSSPASYGAIKLDEEIYDWRIPHKPTVTYIGSEGYPVNDLWFSTSSFADPDGLRTFGARKWRIARVEQGSQYAPPVIVPSDTIILVGAESRDWKYLKGNSGEPSNPVDAWRQVNFNDYSWADGQTSIGYGDGDDSTVLDDMFRRYSTVYLRHAFEITNVDEITDLTLRVYVDDGCIIWINGTEIGRPHVSAGFKAYNDRTGEPYVPEAQWEDVAVPQPYDFLHNGTNVIAVQVINQSLDSSDLSIDVTLTASRGDGGEPGGHPPASDFTYQARRGHYEIDAIWESGEITDFNDAIRIPATTLRPGRTYRVRSRMKDNTGRWSHWSDPVQFVAGEPLSAYVRDYLRLTELMYNPAPADPSKGELNLDHDEFEFIELKNTGDESIDLTYVSFDNGVIFEFNDSNVTTIGPGGFVLVVRNEAAFKSRYPLVAVDRIAGTFSGGLKNGGEEVRLVDQINGVLVHFNYGDGRTWPLAADGHGHALVPIDSAIPTQSEGSLDYPGNWRAGTYINGSPGADDPVPPSTAMLNEIMAHTDYGDPQHPEYESNDWIELYNAGSGSLNLNHWYLSDSIKELHKWAIGDVSVGGHGFISFDEVTGFHDPISIGFGLDKAGEQVVLSCLPGNSQDRIVDCIRFDSQESSVSLGRYPDGGDYLLKMQPSRDLPNAEPILDIVIDELMYHPTDPNSEYIELYNPTAGTITLENATGTWRLDGAVEYDFPPGTSMGSGQRLLIVGVNPGAFISPYDTSGATILGPWKDGQKLANEGERLTLERPQAPDDIADDISWVVVDQVRYSDVSPWPASPDGLGDALQRIHADQYHCGSDPTNWQAAPPTPGDPSTR